MSRFIDRRQILVGAGAASIGVIAAPAIVRAQAKSLKIAVMLPRSGFFAQAGQSCYRGAIAAPAVLSELGYNVEIIHIDTESSADVARTQAEKAINEGARAIIGAFESGQTLAIAQVCEQRKTPLVINVSSAPNITEQGYQYLVRNFPIAGALITNGVKLIGEVLAYQKLDLKTAVFLHANDTFGTSQRAAMDKIFPTLNMPFKIIESIAYDPKAQDLSVEVTKLRSLNPDFLMMATRAGDAVKLTREMMKQRFKPEAIFSPGSPGLYDEEFFQAVGPYADYFAYNLPWASPNSPIALQLEKAFNAANPGKRFGLDCFNVGFTFEALMVAADGFKRAATDEGPALMEAIRKTNIATHVMTGGPIVFNEKGDNPNIDSVCLQNLKNTPTIVFPKKLAQAEPVLPIPPWQGRNK